MFPEMKDPVHAKIERYELTRTIDPSHFFPKIESAIAAFPGLPQISGDAQAPSANDEVGTHD